MERILRTLLHVLGRGSGSIISRRAVPSMEFVVIAAVMWWVLSKII